MSQLTAGTEVTAICFGIRDRLLGHDLAEFFPRVVRFENGLMTGTPSARLRTAFLTNKEGIYYDALQPSDSEAGLEMLMPGYAERSRTAQALLDHVRRTQVTKYPMDDVEADRLDPDGLLILGQVNGDQAIERTVTVGKTNAELISWLYANRPVGDVAAYYYKPHPRNERDNPKEIAAVEAKHPDLRVIDPGVNVHKLFVQKPRVATMTSAAGLEAALHGCEVHTFGTSFYSNFGFTIDHFDCPRRTNRLSAEDVAAFMWIEQTVYVDAKTRTPIPVELAFGLPLPESDARLAVAATIRLERQSERAKEARTGMAKHDPDPPARRHIGLVLPNLGEGGAQRAMLTLAASLIERGYRIDLVLLQLKGPYRAAIPDGVTVYYHRSRTPDADLARYCRARGIPLRPLFAGPLEAIRAWRSLRRRFPRIASRLSRLRAALGVARYVREARPELLLSALYLANDASVLAAALTGRSTPVVVSLRNNVGLDYRGTRKSFARALMPEADAVVAVSKGVAADAVETLGLDARRVHAIYNPKPLAEIRRLAEERVDHPWFDLEAPPVILSALRRGAQDVGGGGQKDWATLVRAFGLVRRRIPARLAILGGLTEAYRHEVATLAGSLDLEADIAFLGFDENPFRYMRRAGLFVLSSRYEGLPNVLIEAMACGTPVVSTDSPFGPAEILEGGRWGRLVPVGDAPALARAIVETLEEKIVPGEALRRRADDFSVEPAVAAYADLFAKLVRPGAAAHRYQAAMESHSEGGADRAPIWADDRPKPD